MAFAEDQKRIDEGPASSGFLDEVEAALDDVRRAIEHDSKLARAAALRLVALLTPPTTAHTAASRGGLAPWQKRKVDRYIREHPEDPLLVKELAEQIPLSVSHFCRAFRVSFGTSPHLHVIRVRMQLAQRLMLTTDDSLTDIAFACGLADQAHLSNLFRREVGETPSSWRRRHRATLKARRAPVGKRSPTMRSTGHQLPHAAPLSDGPSELTACPARA
jgi:AraC family transcriptional regulator